MAQRHLVLTLPLQPPAQSPQHIVKREPPSRTSSSLSITEAHIDPNDIINALSSISTVCHSGRRALALISKKAFAPSLKIASATDAIATILPHLRPSSRAAGIAIHNTPSLMVIQRWACALPSWRMTRRESKSMSCARMTGSTEVLGSAPDRL